MRAAIYARMSTDKQSADSPADQITRCRDFARARGWRVVDDLVAEDAGISGASRHNRPELLQLVARIDEWDVLLCFDFSRLARDSEDLGWIRNRLRLHKRTAFESSSGLDVFNVGSKVLGIINEEFLVKLRADTHRGLRGRFERGLSAGGRPFGYDSVAIPSGQLDARGAPIPAGYKLAPNEIQAAIVRPIFERYVAGESYRSIGFELNRERAPAPRPRSEKRLRPAWSMTAVRTILLNPVYRGELVWNRSEWIKDHETGRRKRHERPEGEWIRREDPELALVSDGLWERAQQAMVERSARLTRTADGRRLAGASASFGGAGRNLLSGLLECAVCGGGFHSIYRGTCGCGRRKDRGPEVCESTLLVSRTELEGRILGAVESQVLIPENVAYVAERALELVRARTDLRDPALDRARLEAIADELANLMRLAAKVGHLDAHAQVLRELEGEKAELEARLASTPEPLDLKALRREIDVMVGDLRSVLANGGGRDVLKRLLGGERLRVRADADRGFAVEGELSWLLGAGAAQGGEGCCVSVVAGTGFEPVTFGL